ncbi:MAG: hypothetical protein JWQ09_5381 [Segetibacter sp.]|nr:hypothetical protein [Segetibacter sp.]
MNDMKMTARGEIMEYSVIFEEQSSFLLHKMLDIDLETSRSFGTTSQALSFNTKMNLLLDMKFIAKTTREKFQMFMEIRNKFAHLAEVDTYEKCFKLLTNYNKLKSF